MAVLDVLYKLDWRPGIGDPTLLGWLTTVAYLVASALCLLCAVRVGRIFSDRSARPHRLVWGGLAAVLLFLGVNKQLDLQSVFTATIREIAFAGGWYGIGQKLQAIFIFLLVVAALLGLICLAWTMRRNWRQYWLLIVGLLFLARFVIVRAATFYDVHLPQLSRLAEGFRINPYLELAGLATIGLAAFRNFTHG